MRGRGARRPGPISDSGEGFSGRLLTMRGRQPASFFLSVVLLAVYGNSTPASADRSLTLQERIEAQRVIECVYHAHVIGDTRPFELAVSTDLLERKVRTYLKQSVALDRLWD